MFQETHVYGKTQLVYKRVHVHYAHIWDKNVHMPSCVSMYGHRDRVLWSYSMYLSKLPSAVNMYVCIVMTVSLVVYQPNFAQVQL